MKLRTWLTGKTPPLPPPVPGMLACRPMRGWTFKPSRFGDLTFFQVDGPCCVHRWAQKICFGFVWEYINGD